MESVLCCLRKCRPKEDPPNLPLWSVTKGGNDLEANVSVEGRVGEEMWAKHKLDEFGAFKKLLTILIS